MKSNVVLNGFEFSQLDIENLTTEFDKRGIIVISYEETNFLPYFQSIGVVAIHLAQNMSLNAAYDTAKYILTSIISKCRIPKDRKTVISVKMNDNTSEIALNFDLTEEQKDKLIDAAIHKMLGQAEDKS